MDDCDPECYICLEPWSVTKTPLRLSCGHGLCSSCWDNLRNKQCPMCRAFPRTSPKFDEMYRKLMVSARCGNGVWLGDAAYHEAVCVKCTPSVGPKYVGSQSVLYDFDESGGDVGDHVLELDTPIPAGARIYQVEVMAAPLLWADRDLVCQLGVLQPGDVTEEFSLDLTLDRINNGSGEHSSPDFPIITLSSTCSNILFSNNTPITGGIVDIYIVYC